MQTCESKLLSIVEAESNETKVESVALQTMKITATTFGKLAEDLLAKIVMTHDGKFFEFR